MRRLQLVALALAVGYAAVACDANESPHPSLPSRTPVTPAASPPTASEVANAVRFRQDYGLRADEIWVRAVAADPASARGVQEFGVPLTLSEVSGLEQRLGAIEPIQRFAVDYGKAHADDYAGTWVDQRAGGVVVTQFTRDVDQHRRDLLAAVRPDAPLEVREVAHTLADLEAAAARLKGEDGWFRTIPAFLKAYGVDEAANAVSVRISSVNPNAETLIANHYGWQGMLKVESDGTGALLLPSGRLSITVRGPNGAVSGLRCVAVPDLPGAYEAPLDAPVTDAAGVCRLVLPATGYWIRFDAVKGPTRTVALGRGVVVAGRTTFLVVTVRAP